MDLADFIRPAGVVEDALRGRGLAGIDMRHDADVSVPLEGCCARHESNSAGATPTCPGPNWSNRGHPALLVQYNKNFAPAPGVNSFLVK